MVKKRKDGRPLTQAQQRKAAAPAPLARLAQPAPQAAKKPLTALKLQRQAEARRDAAQIHAIAKQRRLEAEGTGPSARSELPS